MYYPLRRQRKWGGDREAGTGKREQGREECGGGSTERGVWSIGKLHVSRGETWNFPVLQEPNVYGEDVADTLSSLLLGLVREKRGLLLGRGRTLCIILCAGQRKAVMLEFVAGGRGGVWIHWPWGSGAGGGGVTRGRREDTSGRAGSRIT